MSREAFGEFGDPPESQEPPQVCPLCGGEWHAEDCVFGAEVSRRLKAERDRDNVAMMLRMCAHRLRVNGHGDLSDKAVDLLRRLGLQGSPLRETAPNSKTPNARLSG